jgi:hypothetical protein
MSFDGLCCCRTVGSSNYILLDRVAAGLQGPATIFCWIVLLQECRVQQLYFDGSCYCRTAGSSNYILMDRVVAGLQGSANIF